MNTIDEMLLTITLNSAKALTASPRRTGKGLLTEGYNIHVSGYQSGLVLGSGSMSFGGDSTSGGLKK